MYSQHYKKYTHFKDDVLLALMPDDVYGWMSKQIYSTPTTTADDNTTKLSPSTLAYYKKAI